MNSISFFKALLMKELDQNKSSSEFEIPIDVKIAYKLWKDPNFPPGKLYSFSSGMKNPKDILNRFASELQNSGLIKVSAAGHPYVDALRWLDDNNEKLNEKDLPGNQEKIAQAAEPKDKITAADFAALRAKKDVKKEGEDGELKLGVKYNFNGDSGYISTGGSQNPKDWKFLANKKSYPYLLVKDKLIPSENQPAKYDGAFNLGMGKGHHIDEDNQDHEVSMAQNSLKSIISSASQLMNMLGQDEKDIPAWIQDHITNAENYINQASKNYHEYHNGGEDMDQLPVGNEEEPVDDMTLQSIAEAKFISLKDFSKNLELHKKGDITKSQLITSYNKLSAKDQDKAKELAKDLDVLPSPKKTNETSLKSIMETVVKRKKAK